MWSRSSGPGTYTWLPGNALASTIAVISCLYRIMSTESTSCPKNCSNFTAPMLKTVFPDSGFMTCHIFQCLWSSSADIVFSLIQVATWMRWPSSAAPVAPCKDKLKVAIWMSSSSREQLKHGMIWIAISWVHNEPFWKNLWRANCVWGTRKNISTPSSLAALAALISFPTWTSSSSAGCAGDVFFWGDQESQAKVPKNYLRLLLHHPMQSLPLVVAVAVPALQLHEASQERWCLREWVSQWLPAIWWFGSRISESQAVRI